MKLNPFKLERYFAKYEFSAKFLLSSSDCDGLSLKEILSFADEETKNLWENLTLGYTESLGHPLLRDEVAKLYKNISSDEVLIITPEEGIFIALNTILEKGDNVICTFPGYQSLGEVALGIGAEVTKWYPEEEYGWRFNPEFLENQIKSNTKLVIFNFPHNPTGYLPTKGDFEKILDLARENNLWVFSDEMYRFLEYDEENRLSSVCEVYDKAVSLFGMSKTFGMAGARIGWLITKDKKWYKKMLSFKDYTTICSSAPSEILSLMALRSRDKIIQRHLMRIKGNLSFIDDFFEKYQDLFIWVKPKAGTIGFPRLKLKQSSYEFAETVVKEAGIMILPSSVYNYGDKHFRLGFGRENLPQALSEFSKYLGKNFKTLNSL